ncbi:MAG: ribonuclease HI [Desulfohalobiaceae bacterium]|nr:ribonuclease HI [Desulfohalobiaceae bacterium]
MTESEQTPQVTIYTDGACLGNPGPGGWAALIKSGGKCREIAGGYRRTTNNRMEISALIQALNALETPCRVEAYTDSRYLNDALNKGWLAGWVKNGWRTASKKPVKNRDLWEALLKELQRHRVHLSWTKAHSGQKENERCDHLAKLQAQKTNLPGDPGMESS